MRRKTENRQTPYTQAYICGLSYSRVVFRLDSFMSDLVLFTGLRTRAHSNLPVVVYKARWLWANNSYL